MASMWAKGCLSRLVREPRAAVDYPGLSGAVAVGCSSLRDDHSGDGPSQSGNGNTARACASVVSGGLSADDSYYAAKPQGMREVRFSLVLSFGVSRHLC